MKTASNNYKAVHGEHRELFSRIELCQKQIKQNVQVIGRRLILARKILEKAGRFLNQGIDGQTALWKPPTPVMFDDITRFKGNLRNSSTSNKFINMIGLGTGTAAGSVFSVGSWALVASLGSASTGAAISGLSGAAATNATLAWFGGGALAAGGAGMAGGSLVLGIIMLVPVIGFSSWFTYRSAKKFEKETEALLTDIEKLKIALNSATASLSVITEKRWEIETFCGEFHVRSTPLFGVIRPMGIFSLAKQYLMKLFGGNVLTASQYVALETLASHVDIFLKKLEANNLT